jgi:hypothetical protein
LRAIRHQSAQDFCLFRLLGYPQPLRNPFLIAGCPFSFSTAKKKMDEKKTPAHFDFSQGKRNARPS